MRRKYGNKKTIRIVNGDTVTFDSMAEARRFDELHAMAKAGKIQGLTLQPEYEIIGQVKHTGHRTMRKRKYIADFRYTKNGEVIVEDVKSKPTKTPVYSLKKQLFLSIYGDNLTFKEIL